MVKEKDYTGVTKGILTVLRPIHVYFDKLTKRRKKWLAKCACGNVIVLEASAVTVTSHVKSCGCLLRKSYLDKKGKPIKETHGKTHTRLYRTWRNMKSRCSNLKNHNYGGKGIRVCDEWLNNFQAFYDWSINNGYDDKLTIDRIDSNGNYEPSNCRWITSKTQAHNISTNVNITFNGETHCLAEWAEILGISYACIHHRYTRNWSIERMLQK